jgi:hypothetical protein
MKGRLLQAIAGAVVVVILAASGAPAQSPSPTPQADAASQLTPEQLDPMLAPIALYPDGLLADILMAATYPLEVVEADRWLEDPHNASLRGERLAAALEQQAWDPSVKSLVPYPRIVHMMDSKLEWTERLGEAFLADAAAVMDSIQRLRRRAQSAGVLVSAPQAVVTTAEPEITIEPPSQEFVYFPVCDPSLVYGAWPYPAYPPDYFPDFFAGATVGGFGCGWFSAPIIGPLWGWRHWNWRAHRIDIDRDKFAALNGNRPPIGDGVWEHDLSHRHGVPYRDPQLRARFAGTTVSPERRRALRGYPTGATPQIYTAPGAGAAPVYERTPANRVFAPPTIRPVPPTFESFGRGADVRIQSERGYSSRMSAPTMAPGGFAPHFAPSGGGARFR